MDAAIAHLDGQIDPVLVEIKSRESQDDIDRDRLGEHYSYLLSEYEGQTTFLRNSTLVSLASQLTHSLHRMASFGPLNLDDSEADRSSSSECDCGCDHREGLQSVSTGGRANTRGSGSSTRGGLELTSSHIKS